MGCNVAHNSIGTVINVSLSSAPVKELHPPILSMLVVHGVQVKRERDAEQPKYDILLALSWK